MVVTISSTLFSPAVQSLPRKFQLTFAQGWCCHQPQDNGRWQHRPWAENSRLKKGMKVFIVLGLGGSPEKPAKLFVIPLSLVKQRMDWETLHEEPKFYYRISERRLYWWQCERWFLAIGYQRAWLFCLLHC